MEEDHKEELYVEEPLSLTELPEELIMKILSCLDYQYHNRFRCTSKRLQAIHTQFMMHWYRVFKRRVNYPDIPRDKRCIYNVLQYSTEYYMISGFESQFCGCLVSLYNRVPKGDSVPHINKVCEFLTHFYEVVESQDIAKGLHCRLLNTLTLFNLFSKFKTLRILKFKKVLLHWRIVIELRGKFMGVLWSNIHPERRTMKKRNDVFHMVSQLLYSDMMEIPMQRFWELENIVYVYGTVGDFSRQKLSPARITFTFMINTHDSLAHMLRSTLLCSDYVPQSCYVDQLPSEAKLFDVNLKIRSRAALAWGCDNSLMELDFTDFEADRDDINGELDEEANENGSHCELLNA